MKRAAIIYPPGPPQDTIEGATHIQTPSQAKLGLGGAVLFFRLNTNPSEQQLFSTKGGMT